MIKNSGIIRIMQKAGGYSDFSISGGRFSFVCGTLTGDDYGHSEDHIHLNEEETKRFIKILTGREDASIESIIFSLSIKAFTTSHLEKILEKAEIKYVREHINIDGKGSKIYK